MLLALALAACIAPEYADAGDSAGRNDVIDLRVDYPDPPPGGLQIVTPDLEVPPYSDALKCFYGQWDGPDMGVVGMVPLHPNQFHHHSLLKDVPPTDTHQNGDFVDCGGPEDSGGMQRAPLFHAVLIDDMQGDGDYLALPDGIAMKLPSGIRWSADIHYVNTTDKTLLVNNAFNLELVPADEVEMWISSFEHDIGQLDIPPGGEYSASFDCAVGDYTSVLSISSHMHSYGTGYRVDVVRADGNVENILDVDRWIADYRYLPPRADFLPGEVQLGPGDKLRTTCTWFNSTDSVLAFPTEMCTTSGVAMNIDAPVYCENGTILDRGL